MVAVVEITLLCLGRERPTMKRKYEGLFCATAQKAQERTHKRRRCPGRRIVTAPVDSLPPSMDPYVHHPGLWREHRCPGWGPGWIPPVSSSER